ncbi:MAG: DUF2045 domain-containing protein [Lachnospiraceae bacterium]|nr:DUF2045 domain-containing protein [Lachnospiraceae bacterium]
MWKKRMKQIVWSGYCDLRLRALVTGIFALIWWGVLYPELCFTEDTFQQIVVTDGEEKAAGDADYRDILDAAGDEIVIRSRLLEWLEEQEWFRHKSAD